MSRRLQGFVRQAPQYNQSRKLFKFRFTTCWAENGRIHMEHSLTGEYNSVTWQAFGTRAVELQKHLAKMEEHGKYGGEQAQLRTLVTKMQQLVYQARQQPQPPLVWDPRAAAAMAKRGRIVVPGEIIDDTPKKLLLPPGYKHANAG